MLAGNGIMTIVSVSVFIFASVVSVFVVFFSVKNKQLRDKLNTMDTTFQQLVERTQVGVYILKGERFSYVNPTFADVFGYEPEEMLNMKVSDITSQSEFQDLKKIQSLLQNGNSDHLRFKYQGLRSDGQEIYLDIHGSSLPYEENALIGTVVDLTKQRESQMKAHKLTFFDSLTLLPNRYSLYQKLDELIRLGKLKHQTFALIMLDLDRFKMINDSMGYDMGDALLTQTAKRLIRHTSFDVYRHNGDEFALVVPNTDRTAVTGIADRIMELFEKPFMLGSSEVYTTLSMGISFYPGDGQTKEQLLKNADTAIYYVKKAGKSHYQFYEQSFDQDLRKKITLETELRRALEKDEFILHYQPQVDLQSGEIIGHEALIRWNHPERGLCMPAAFIEYAEETDLIIPIGEWVLRTACLQAKRWHDDGHKMFVSVNLSPKQLFEKNFVKKIATILNESAFDPKFLELEITETVMVNKAHTIPLLRKIKALGVNISIDDFGKGYSSLTYLKDLPIDKLKIDQSFIKESDRNNSDSILVKTIIGMAHHLNLQVIAEGVERLGHIQLLKGQQCYGAQGYLFNRPMPAEGVIEGLKDLTHRMENYLVTPETIK